MRGGGLCSQDTRCREFAKYKGYEVTEVFRDDSFGSLTSRPVMQAMLSFLSSNRKEPQTVIINDISRLVRGLMAHFELRVKISDAGGVLVIRPSSLAKIQTRSLLKTFRSPSRSTNARRTANKA